MLKDITIGQYFPGKSIIHKLDPRVKIVLVFLFIVTLFVANDVTSLLINVAFVIVLYVISRIPLKMILKGLKPIVPIIVFTAILNIFFVDGRVLWKIGFIEVTDKGLEMSAIMIIRVLCLIAGTSLLTYTTSPIALTDALERLMKPLNKIKVPVHELAMMMTIALRFIPTLIEETDKIMSAQKARGADMETGSIIQRAKALVPILIPLFVSSFRRADELAMAMECRCYRGGEGRTRMRQLHIKFLDILSIFVVSAFLVATIYIARF